MRSVSTWCEWRWHRGVPPNAPQNSEDAVALINKLYALGAPFFRKDNIRTIHEQLQSSHGSGDIITVRDVAGAMMDYTLRTGETCTWLGEDGVLEKRIMYEVRTVSNLFYKLIGSSHEPEIGYRCRAHLIHHIWTIEKYFPSGYQPDEHSPLSSLQIYGSTKQVAPDTQNLLPDSPLPTPGNLTGYFQEQIQAWKDTDMCKRVIQILELSAVRHDVDKVVAVSLGSISTIEREVNRSAFQHALVLTLREWLQTLQKPFSCYAQDPAYKSMDRALLGEYGIEVIDDPRAWLEVDEKSILFSCASDVPVKEIVADIARPAVVIWEQLTDNDGDVEGEDSL
jgi:hypothetical protein